MTTDKKFRSRILQKHDIEANWLKATGFTPLAGEIIIYDEDEQHNFVRIKIGDGETNVNDLSFVKNAIIDAVNLPTENINQEAIYRVLDTIAYVYGEPLYDPKINYVNALPEEGEGAIDPETDEISFYYNISDGLVYCYVDEELSAAAGAEGMDLPVGWHSYNTFATLMGGLGTMILNVYALPEQGMPAMNLDTGDSWIYYHSSENEAYCYINEALSQFINNQFGMTISTGWYPYSQLPSLADINYQGIFTKREDIPNEGLSILVNNILYTYNDHWDQIGGAQIQANWDQSDDTQPDYIQNKPIIATPDWNVSNGPGVILNKPCGEVYAGTIIYNGSVECNSRYQGQYVTTGYYQQSPPEFLEGVQYKMILDESKEWIGIAENGQVRIDNAYIEFDSNSFQLVSNSDLSGSHHLCIQVNQSGSYQINPKYLPEGAKIGKRGSITGAEVFNDYQNNNASGVYSHAEGYQTTANGHHAHAEGNYTIASGDYSHAEGHNTIASGHYTHAEGNYTIASGDYSHAEGWYTIAAGDYQHAQGKYNIEDTDNKYAHIVGNGTNDIHRSNAHTLDWNGNAWFAGTVESKGIIIDDGNGNKTKIATIAEPTRPDNGKTLQVVNGKPAWKLPDKELPEVSIEDNNKVLKVIDGVWQTGSASSTQADWNIADESLPGAIKNKPFGYIRTVIVDIEATFQEPADGANVLLGYFPPTDFVNGQICDVYLDNELLWQAIEWPFNDATADNTISISGNQIMITGKSEEETHSIKIMSNIAKKLDSEWLNIQTLPDASNAEWNGVALVVKNGEWVISEIPVANMSDLSSIQGTASHAHDRIDILESSFTAFQTEVNAHLGDIDTALDRIIAIQEELMGESSTTLITFTIDGTEHQAEDGMTWGEWIDSDYNTVGAAIMTMDDGNQLVTKVNTNAMLRYDGVPPHISDMIINGAVYVWD